MKYNIKNLKNKKNLTESAKMGMKCKKEETKYRDSHGGKVPVRITFKALRFFRQQARHLPRYQDPEKVSDGQLVSYTLSELLKPMAKKEYDETLDTPIEKK